MNRPAPPDRGRLAALAAAGVLLLGAAAVTTAVIALAGLGHLSADLDPTAVPNWLWRYRGDPDVRRWLGVGAAGSSLGVVVIAVAALLAGRRPLHGAARWARPRDIAHAGLRSSSGVVLGQAAGAALVFGGSEHVLLQAPTRSGKGVGVVIPNLLTWPGSVVVLDIKQENWRATAGYRARAGQEVLMFDPLDPQGRTARYNPLGHIDRTDPIETLDELQKIAGMLFPSPDHADPFWTEAARTGFIGVGALIADSPALPFTLGEIYRQLTQGDPRTRLPGVVKQRAAEGRPLPGPCASALMDFSSAGENTFASIKQTLTARMALWLNPRVDAATSASDFDVRQLRRRPMSVYLGVSPADILRTAPLYALLFQQLIDLNTRELPDRAREPLDVLVLLDEFARLGHAPFLAKAFAYVAGYGLRLLPVLQSPAQLRAVYGPDGAEEIVSNCAIEVHFAPKELKAAQDLSERLGSYTYSGRALSRPVGLGAGRRSLTLSDQKRALMLPQELMALKADALIVLKAGAPPICGTKLRYFTHRRLRRRILPPPVTPRIASSPPALTPPPDPGPLDPLDDFSFEALVRTLEREGAPPPPPTGAEEAVLGEWVDAMIDQAVVASPRLKGRPDGRNTIR